MGTPENGKLPIPFGNICRDSNMGVVWEACMGPMSCVGVPENPADVDFFSDVMQAPYRTNFVVFFCLKSVGCNPMVIYRWLVTTSHELVQIWSLIDG